MALHAGGLVSLRSTPPRYPDSYRELREVLAWLKNKSLGVSCFSPGDRDIAQLTPGGLAMLIEYWSRQ